MNQQLPSLTKTYIRTFKLYFKTFLDVLPLLLLYLVSEYLLNSTLPQEFELTFTFFLRILLDALITTLFFSIMIFGMYQKLHTQRFVFMETIMKGLSSFWQLFLAYLIVYSPIFLSLGLLMLMSKFWQPIQGLNLIILIVALLMTLVMLTYCFIAGVYIVIEKANAISGLKQSWNKIRQGYWLDTLLAILFLVILKIGIGTVLFDYLHVNYTNYILTILMTSLYPALMIIRFDQISHSERA